MYVKKNADDRKKILIIRKFDNISQHAIDQCALAILELSRRKFFNELNIEIYGDGAYWEELILPFQQFENVHIHRSFIPNKDIHKVHAKLLLTECEILAVLLSALGTPLCKY